MRAHSVPVGVQQGGVLDPEKSERAARDLNNKRDWFSPASTFGPSGRAMSFFLSPFVNVGTDGQDDGYGRDDALNLFTYGASAIVAFIGMFLYTVVLLGAWYTMGFDDINTAETAIYVSLISAVTWWGIVRFWPFDRRVAPTLNPAIEVARWLVGDNSSLALATLNTGVLFAGAALGGYTIQWLGWWQFGAACIPVTGTKAGCTVVNEALAAGESARLYALDFVLTGLVSMAYVLIKKIVSMGQTAQENWSATVTGTAAVLFGVSMFGIPHGFYSFNPAIYLGALAASGTADVNSGDDVLDSLIFIMVRILAAPALAASLYYAVRGVVWLSERYGNTGVRLMGKAGAFDTSGGRYSSDATQVNAALVDTRSSGLRSRFAGGRAEELSRPLITDY